MATVTYEAGLMEIWIQTWDDENQCYTGTPIRISGDHEFTYKPSDDETVLASGDDAAWAIVTGARSFEGTLSIYALTQDIEAMLYPRLKTDAGLLLGDSTATHPYVGIMVDYFIAEDGKKSVNRTIFYRCVCTEAEEDHETASEDGPATSDLEISFKAYPCKYTDTDGNYYYRIGMKVNSEKNPAMFKALGEGFIAPSTDDLTVTE